MKKINRQGFTLIEIITTVIILGVIMTVAVIAVNRYIERAKDSTYNSYVNNIEVAAENHMIDCVSGKSDCDIPESGYSKRLTVESLIEAGYSEKLKDPDKEGTFCTGYVLVTNEGASIPDLKYKGCLKCSNNKPQADCDFVNDSDDDNKIADCASIVGQSTDWTRNTRTIKYGCDSQGENCKYKKTFSGTPENPVIKQVNLETVNGEICPVNIYIDTTKPECDLIIGEANVSESGWYIEDVDVSLYPKTKSERGLGDFEFGISTSTKKDYNSKDKITVTKGITTVFGYVKDELGNEGYCTQEIKVDTDKPAQSLILGYQVYPENKNKTSTDTNEQILQINDLEKYKSVKGILVFLKDSTTGNIQINYSVDSANTSGTGGTGGMANTGSITSSYKDDMNISFENKQMIEFIFPVARTINTLDISGINPETIDKVVMLVGNPNGLYTNKDMLVYNFAKDETTGVGDEYSYSFDGGNTWQTEKYKWYSSNGTVVTRVKDSIGSSSEEHLITINQIDKTAPKVKISAHKYVNGNKEDLITSAENSNILITNWKNYNYIFDLKDSTDEASGIDYVNWGWNAGHKKELNKTLSGNDPGRSIDYDDYSLETDGIRYAEFIVYDKAGNSKKISAVVYIDKVGPNVGSLTLKKNNSSGSTISNNAAVNTNIYVTKTNGSDSLSGHSSTTYTVKRNGTIIDSNVTSAKTYTQEGIYELTVTTKDAASNTSTRQYGFTIDKTVPVLTVAGYRCTDKNNCNSSKTGNPTNVVANSTAPFQELELSTWSLNGGVFEYSVNDANFDSVSWSWNNTGCYSGCDTTNSTAETTNKAGYKTLTGSGLRKATLTASDKAGNRVSVDVIVNISKDFKITLDQQGGNGTSEIYERYGVGYYNTSKSKINSISKPSKTGYTFDGYYTSSNGEGEQMVDSNGKIIASNTKFTSNTTWYAKWTAKTVIVTFNKNEGSENQKTATQNFTYGVSGNKFGFQTNGTPKWEQTGQFGKWDRIGYTLLGWSTQPAATTNTYTVYSNVTDNWINSNYPSINLYCVWKADNYTVTFDPNGGSISQKTKVVTYDSTYGTLPTPTKTGYNFLGWFTSASGTTKVTKSSTVTTASNHTLYAKWQALNYIVTFDANDGSVSPPSKIITYNSTYGTLPTPTRTGYNFFAWYTSPDGGIRITESSTVTTASYHTLYARWYVCGDVDLNETVNIKDVTLLQEYVLGKENLSKIQLHAADVNNSGIITSTDKEITEEHCKNDSSDACRIQKYIASIPGNNLTCGNNLPKSKPNQ